MDLFLKFESEEQATPLLYTVVTEYRDENGLLLQPDMDGNYPETAVTTEVKQPKFLNIDVIGDIYKPTGETTTTTGPSGEEITVPVLEKLPGYHVNIRLVGEDAADLEPYAVVPTNPVRVWA